MYISIYVIEDSSVSDMLLQLPQPPKLYNIKESTGHYNTIKQKRKIYEITKNLTISLITLLLGCNPSENYLKNHEVFPYSEEIVQEKKYKISVKEANDLYVKYLYGNKKSKDLDYDETRLSPTLIIDDHYVYSFQNLVMQKVAVFGIWINANTGEITTNDESIWLEEKDIVSFKK
jgi:hypothetical protein